MTKKNDLPNKIQYYKKIYIIKKVGRTVFSKTLLLFLLQFLNTRRIQLLEQEKKKKKRLIQFFNFVFILSRSFSYLQ